MTAAQSGSLVSVVMPTWNTHEPWLRVAVESVLAQQRCRVELVVVDDGSERPASEVLAGIGDARLRVVRVEHTGVAEARNAGFAVTEGEYLRFVDADDVVPPGSTAHLLALAGAGGDTIAYGATLYCDRELRPSRTLESDVQGDAREACLLGRFTVRLPALLFPRGAVVAAGRWDARCTPCDDWDFVLRTLEHASVRGDATVVYWYRKHPTSLSSSRDAVDRGTRCVVERYLERHPEHVGTRVERQARAGVDLIGAQMRRAEPRSYVAFLLRAAVRDPVAATREVLDRGAGAARRLRWHS